MRFFGFAVRLAASAWVLWVWLVVLPWGWEGEQIRVDDAGNVTTDVPVGQPFECLDMWPLSDCVSGSWRRANAVLDRPDNWEVVNWTSPGEALFLFVLLSIPSVAALGLIWRGTGFSLDDPTGETRRDADKDAVNSDMFKPFRRKEHVRLIDEHWLPWLVAIVALLALGRGWILPTVARARERANWMRGIADQARNPDPNAPRVPCIPNDPLVECRLRLDPDSIGSELIDFWFGRALVIGALLVVVIVLSALAGLLCYWMLHLIFLGPRFLPLRAGWRRLAKYEDLGGGRWRTPSGVIYEIQDFGSETYTETVGGGSPDYSWEVQRTTPPNWKIVSTSRDV